MSLSVTLMVNWFIRFWVFCIRDLDDFDNLRSVNFDGSTLYGENEKIIPEIKVSKDTTYSHRKSMSLYNRLEK